MTVIGIPGRAGRTRRSGPRSRSGRSAGVVLLATALSVTLAACSGSGSGGSAAPAGAGGASGGTLRFGTNQQFEDWETVTKQNATFTSLVYESLLGVAADGYTLKPQLATEWKESPLRVDFTLRPDVLFHDGTRFDAAAVVANLERVRKTPSQYRSQLDAVKSVTAVDDTHVRIDLREPAPALVNNLARLGMYMVSPKALADGDWKTKGVGTGPWRYDPKASVKGLRTVVTAFDKYYDKKSVGPARVEVTQINDPDSLYNALRAGQLDVVWSTPPLAARAEKEGLKSAWFPSVLWHLQMYDTDGVFKDKKFRQAVCHAMNPQDYVDAALGGKGGVPLQRFPEGQPGHDPALRGHPHDLDKAKRLMSELGGGKRSFTLVSYDTQRAIAELFRSQMERIGVEVELEMPNFPQFLSVYQSGKYPAAILSDGARSGPYDYYIRKFAPDAAGNPLKVAYPRLDASVEKGLDAETPRDREAAWQEISTIVDEEALDCGYFDYSGFWAYNPKKVDNIVSTHHEVAVFRYKEARPQG
ncbi:ABC transporter substrate-binding protein [Streptomyces sp. NPDC014894]|uniref:ABC transporter substrate-binding protein n=1 Tax=Streptomyces sp. NPDC014894 TaxID=3364931 RepID=UPI0036F5D4E4